MCCLVWLGRFKCIATGLDASLSSFSTSRRFSRNRLPSRLPVSTIYNFSVILTDRLGLGDIFSALRMKGQILYRALAHLTVPG